MDVASSVLHNRGPDEYNFIHTPIAGTSFSLFLGINRLVIKDAIGGKQPFQSSDQKHTLVFNGEIFDCKTIRSHLIHKGYHFLSDNSDTETLLYSLVDQGLPVLSSLRGMYAGAFFSTIDRTLDLFVDFPGHKNLLWSLIDGNFYFSSELLPFMHLENIDLTPSFDSLAAYLALGFIPAPSTVYKQIFRLSSGSILSVSVSNDGLILKNDQIKLTEPDIISVDLEHLLVDTTRLWLSSDYSISTLISGGVDSALITSIASRFTNVESFCFGFSDDHLRSFDEVADAKLTASFIGCDFTEVVISESTFFENLITSLSLFAEPFSGSIPSFFLFQKISSKYRVTLTGNGADELFGNYGRPSKYYAPSFDCSSYISQFYSPDGFPVSSAISPQLSVIECSEFFRNTPFTAELHNELSNDFLRYNDIFSMHYSVESRSPFLDQNIIKHRIFRPDLFTSPSPGLPKQKLYDIACKFLPKSTITRPKKGLTFPFSYGLRSGKLTFDLFPVIDSMVSDGIIPQAYASFISSQLTLFFSGSNKNLDFIWRVICLSIWYNFFLLR